jgi:hypothetical protein
MSEELSSSSVHHRGETLILISIRFKIIFGELVCAYASGDAKMSHRPSVRLGACLFINRPLFQMSFVPLLVKIYSHFYVADEYQISDVSI